VAVWINGTLVPDEEAQISVFDHGLVTGDGVFETVKVSNGVPFALTRHLNRLARSATGLGLAEPDLDQVREGALAVIEASEKPELARMRITVTGGIAPLGSERGGSPLTAIVAIGSMKPVASWVDVTTVPWPRNEHGALSGLKTTSYGENVRALAYAAERGGNEAIFANTAGNLCEGTGSNVFVVSGGQLLTPPLTAGCLAGVTRRGAGHAVVGAGRGGRSIPYWYNQGRAANSLRGRSNAGQCAWTDHQKGHRSVRHAGGRVP
jgi:branched-chain amino acid aminotransferase